MLTHCSSQHIFSGTHFPPNVPEILWNRVHFSWEKGKRSRTSLPAALERIGKNGSDTPVSQLNLFNFFSLDKLTSIVEEQNDTTTESSKIEVYSITDAYSRIPARYNGSAGL